MLFGALSSMVLMKSYFKNFYGSRNEIKLQFLHFFAKIKTTLFLERKVRKVLTYFKVQEEKELNEIENNDIQLSYGVIHMSVTPTVEFLFGLIYGD